MKSKTIRAIHELDTTALAGALPRILARAGYTPVVEAQFTYAEGKLPVLLIAHIDTVHRIPPTKIYFDQQAQVMWSPYGLGADDRAGVAMILSLLERGYRPSVLFTDGEETGCTGARQATAKLAKPSVNLLIELDRCNYNDSVFYQLDHDEFKSWVNKFGWVTARGTMTDISHLCPTWGIAGVNLSVGYYDQHTNGEYLNLNDWRNAESRVVAMLNDLPTAPFVYKGFTYQYGGNYGAGRFPMAPIVVDESDDDAMWLAYYQKKHAPTHERALEVVRPGYKTVTIIEENGRQHEEEMRPHIATCDLCNKEAETFYELDYCMLCEDCYKESVARLFKQYAGEKVEGGDGEPHKTQDC